MRYFVNFLDLPSTVIVPLLFVTNNHVIESIVLQNALNLPNYILLYNN